MEGYTKIGRIRPNYTGAWNAGTAYTVLEMVKNEAGTASYIAKQDVPAGTPLTDEAYWAMVLDAGDVIDAAEKATERANKAADALGIVQTATGSVIAASDASDMPLKGLKLFGKTTQNGTPTPETPIDLVSVGEAGSITARVCGKNLFNADYIELLTVYEDRPQEFHYGAKFHGAGTYTISCNAYDSDTFIYAKKIKADGSLGDVMHIATFAGLKTHTLQLLDNEGLIVFDGLTITTKEAAMQHFVYAKTQVEISAVATAYEAPIPAQTLTAQTPNGLAGIPVSSGGNYIDSNGQQWVCDEIDLVRGVYIKRVRKRNLSEIAWNYSRTNTAGDCAMFSSTAFSDRLFYPTLSIMCDVLTAYHNKDGVQAGSINNAIALNHTNGYYQYGYVSINPTLLNAVTGAGLKEWFASNNAHIIYPIEPIETPLTAEEIAAYRALHSNYPNTTIYNDGGADMEVKYVADTKLYIDNKFAAMQEAIINA